MKKKIKVIIQHDSMDCGVACLAMICEYHGKSYSLEKLKTLCIATAEGVSMLNISETAELLGLHSITGRISEEQRDVPLPCIIHWNQNHFVVLYKIRHQKYYVADPARGHVEYSKEEFYRHWLSTQSKGEEKGIAMILQPTPLFYETGNCTYENRRSIHFLLGYLKQYRKYFFQIVLGLVLGCIIQLILPFLTQSIVDVGIKSQQIGFIWLVLAGQLILTISRTIVDFIRRWLLLHISMRINISLLSDFFIKLMRLPMSFFDTKLLGDILQRMNDHGRIETFLTSQTLTVMFSTLSFLVFGVVLFFYNSLIFGVFCIGSLTYSGWILIFLHRRKIIDYELFEKQSENNNKTFQLITAMQEIKLQDCEQRRRWEWEEVQADLFQVQMKGLKLSQSQEAGCILINETKNIIITVISATAVIHGDMTFGMMLAVQYIIGQLNSPIEQLMSFFYSLQDVKISLERINEIHAFPDENGKDRTISAHNRNHNGIMIKNVCFKYDKHLPKYTLEDINIHIAHGKITAIVGASGSGKTTLLKTILGYYPIQNGMLTIEEDDINKINLKWWRRQCGVVMQDGIIFSESIARNIAVGDGEIDLNRLEKASEIACAKEFIMNLPLKYNTKIGRDGVGLSQGQKQRILIARAVYKNPDYMFFDEATNALDAKNERAIVENLTRFYKGKTVVVVAHRLSTVRNADNIVVLDKGRVVESGKHTALIAKKGVYFNLIKNQLELGN